MIFVHCCPISAMNTAQPSRCDSISSNQRIPGSQRATVEEHVLAAEALFELRVKQPCRALRVGVPIVYENL